MGRAKRIWYLSPMRAAKVQASLRIRAVSPEPSLLAHTSSESRGTFRQKTRSIAPLNGWACAVKMCHDGMLEDTNSLVAAHMVCNEKIKMINVNKLPACLTPINNVSNRGSNCGISVNSVMLKDRIQVSRNMTKKNDCAPSEDSASAQSDQSLRCPHEESLVLSYPLSAQRRL